MRYDQIEQTRMSEKPLVKAKQPTKSRKENRNERRKEQICINNIKRDSDKKPLKYALLNEQAGKSNLA